MSLDVNENAPGPSPDATDVKEPATVADPSPVDEGVKEQPDLMSIVRDAVQPKKEEVAEAPPATEEVHQSETAEKTEDGDGKSEEDKPPPFAEHPAWKRQITLRRKAEAEATELRPLAESHRQVQTFLTSHGLSTEEAADALITFALAKSDPVAAWEKIRPFAEQVARSAGVILPDDVQQRVAAGEISQQAALDLAKAQARATTLEQQRALDMERAQRQQAEQHQSAVINTVNKWCEDRQKKDPNFQSKQPAMELAILKVRTERGYPRSEDEARAQLDEAYRIVNQTFPVASAAPAPAARTPQQPIRAGTVSGTGHPTPRSTMEAVYSAVGMTPPQR